MGNGVVENGMRWASNILVELLNTYGRHMSSEARKQLKIACTALQEAQTEVRAEAEKSNV